MRMSSFWAAPYALKSTTMQFGSLPLSVNVTVASRTFTAVVDLVTIPSASDAATEEIGVEQRLKTTDASAGAAIKSTAVIAARTAWNRIICGPPLNHQGRDNAKRTTPSTTIHCRRHARRKDPEAEGR
jgi:hypothetical protein